MRRLAVTSLVILASFLAGVVQPVWATPMTGTDPDTNGILLNDGHDLTNAGTISNAAAAAARRTTGSVVSITDNGSSISGIGRSAINIGDSGLPGGPNAKNLRGMAMAGLRRKRGMAMRVRRRAQRAGSSAAPTAKSARARRAVRSLMRRLAAVLAQSLGSSPSKPARRARSLSAAPAARSSSPASATSSRRRIRRAQRRRSSR